VPGVRDGAGAGFFALSAKRASLAVVGEQRLVVLEGLAVGSLSPLEGVR